MQIHALAQPPRLKPVSFGNEKPETLESNPTPSQSLDALLSKIKLDEPILDQLNKLELPASHDETPTAAPQKPKKAGFVKTMLIGIAAALASDGLPSGKASAQGPGYYRAPQVNRNPYQPYFVGPGPNPYANPYLNRNLQLQSQLVHNQLRTLELQYQLQKNSVNPLFRNPVLEQYQDLQFYRQLNQLHQLYHLQNPQVPHNHRR